MTAAVALALLVALILLVPMLRALAGLLRRPKAVPAAAPARPAIYVDGSNVMHWGDGVPSARTLALVLEKLQALGYDPVVWFDANAGYKLAGWPMRHDDLARVLPVPALAIRMAPGGQPADPLLIDAALSAGARVVSNDRFMDWRAEFPGLLAKGVLVKGQVRGAKVELTL